MCGACGKVAASGVGEPAADAGSPPNDRDVGARADTDAADSGLADSSIAGDALIDQDPIADAAPEAEADADAGMTVNGTIIDTYHRPLSGLQVLIGTDLAVTDANGRFAFDQVVAPYDVAFKVYNFNSTPPNPDVWIYRGLTRRDPTLQTGRVLGPNRRGLMPLGTNVQAPVQADGGQVPVLLAASFGSPEVAVTAYDIPHPGGSLIISDIHWFGQGSTTGTVHALAWGRPSGRNSSGTDNQYLAYSEQPLILVDMGRNSYPQEVTLDFSPTPVTSRIFEASVRANWGAAPAHARSLSGLVVFDTNAQIPVAYVRDAFATSSLSVPMPVLPGSHVVFTAKQGRMYQGNLSSPFGFVRREVISPATAVALEIPEPRVLLAPPTDAEGIDTSTLFEWSAASSVSVFSMSCSALSFRVHSVSAEHTGHAASIPALDTSLPKDAECYWNVDVHGSYRTVDDATGPSGMIEPCLVGTCEDGSPRGEGSGSQTEWRLFKTTP